MLFNAVQLKHNKLNKYIKINKFSDSYSTTTVFFSSLLHYFFPVAGLKSQNRESE